MEMQAIVPEPKDEADFFMRDAMVAVRRLKIITCGPLAVIAIVCLALMVSDATKLAQMRIDRSHPERIRDLGTFLRALSVERIEVASGHHPHHIQEAIRQTEKHAKGPVAAMAEYKALRGNNASYNAMGNAVLVEMHISLADLASTPQRAMLSTVCLTHHFVATSMADLLLLENSSWDAATASQWISVAPASATEDPLKACLRALLLPTLSGVPDIPLLNVTAAAKMHTVLPESLAAIAEWRSWELSRVALYFTAWEEVMAETFHDIDQSDSRLVAGVVLCIVSALASALGAVLCLIAINAFSKTSTIQAQVHSHFAGTENHLAPFEQSFTTMNVADFDESLDRAARYPTSVIGVCATLIHVLQRVRPFLPQSVFGEIEGVSATSRTRDGKTTGMLALDVVAPELALSHAVRRDLRTELGMQLVSAVMMFVSLGPFHQKVGGTSEDYERYDDDYLSPLLCTYLSLIQRAVNANHGVVHSICDTGVVAVWNVVSSSYLPQVNALQAAAEIIKGFKSFLGVKRPSMSIVTSDSMAGNLVMNPSQRIKGVYIVGRAAFLAEKLEPLNEVHQTSVLMDKESATAVVSYAQSVEWCVRPVGLMKDRVGDEVEVWALHTHKIHPDRLKEWNAAFYTVQKSYFQNKYEAGLQAMREYVKKYGNLTEKKGRDSFEDTSAKWMVKMLTAKNLGIVSAAMGKEGSAPVFSM